GGFCCSISQKFKWGCFFVRLCGAQARRVGSGRLAFVGRAAKCDVVLAVNRSCQRSKRLTGIVGSSQLVPRNKKRRKPSVFLRGTDPGRDRITRARQQAATRRRDRNPNRPLL